MTESPNRDTSNDSEGMSMTIDELIEALGKLSGPDWNIDSAIARLDDIREQIGDCADNEVPPYTSSVDAAMTLVPEQFEWEVSGGNERVGSKPWAYVCPKEQPFPVELEFYADGASPAVALCIAALRARQSPHGEGG